MIDKLPPEDGSYWPTEENEPTEELLYSLWTFEAPVHYYVDKYGEFNGLEETFGHWYWLCFEVHEELSDPFNEYEDLEDKKQFSLYMVYEDNDGILQQDEAGGNGPYETPKEAMMDAWYIYYSLIAYEESEK
jgi:hypothetical protein